MKSKYQTWIDWILGRWTCPKCKTTWTSMTLFSDATCVGIKKGRIIEKTLECLECGFIERIIKNEY